jgi:predicted RNA-binding protein (virulence factor B family)
VGPKKPGQSERYDRKIQAQQKKTTATMMQLGKAHTYVIERFTPQGAYVRAKIQQDKSDEEVLLPNKYLTLHAKIGDEVEAYLMKDSNNRRVAIGEFPKIQLNACAILEITAMNLHGAFADWGLDKELFIPFAEQREGIEIGESYPVMLCYDQMSDRLFGSMKINKKLLPGDASLLNQRLSFFVTEYHELGWKGVVDQKYQGMLYASECKIPISLGLELFVFVHEVRSDGKLDLKLSSSLPQKYDEATSQLEAYLAEHKFLYLTDKSDASEIYQLLNMSKKTFKQAIGKLYKQRKIKLFSDKIARLDE